MESPARKLMGQELEGGWKVSELIEPSAVSTGGHFSVGYKVIKEDGSSGYLKAFDYSRALTYEDPAPVMNALTQSFLFERNILQKCSAKRLDRVVQAIADGTVRVEDHPAGVVQYLIFELAEGDIRTQMDFSEEIDTAWALRALHHIANGLQQLHGEGIAHQDVKPSNVLVFEKKSSKISDVGRSAMRGYNPPHEQFEVAGDKTYAPPELLYGHIEKDWNKRRFGCDLYLLGSMAVFLFSQQSMTPLLFSQIPDSHKPDMWAGNYEDVLPVIRDSFSRAVDIIKGRLDFEYKDELLEIVRQLCDPDPNLRGHPRDRIGFRNPHSLERYVSKFDLLARKAEFRMVKGM